MKTQALILLLASTSTTIAFAQVSTNTCPPTAVYLALANEVRGYPANANGRVAPCQRILGSASNLASANAVAVSRNGLLHVLQFNNEGDLTIYDKTSTGAAAPTRTVFFANDLISNAVDSRVNDYVLYGFTSTGTVFIAPVGATDFTDQVVDPSLAYGGSIAIDPDDNLVFEGADTGGNILIDTFKTSLTFKNPPLVRRLTGPLLGLPSTGLFSQFSNSISMAVDPGSEELYVYSESSSGADPRISVFSPEASGNVAPVRVLSGPATLLGANNTGFHTGSARIAVSGEGRLFVSEGGNTILVFAPGATGNAAPSQVIVDSLGPVVQGSLTFLGGIGVRSCVCHY